MNDLFYWLGVIFASCIGVVIVAIIGDMIDSHMRHVKWSLKEKADLESKLQITERNYERLEKQYKESEARGFEMSAMVCCGGGIYSTDSGHTACKFINPPNEGKVAPQPRELVHPNCECKCWCNATSMPPCSHCENGHVCDEGDIDPKEAQRLIDEEGYSWRTKK